MKYENRHRELREALSWTTEDAVSYRKRQADVWDFDERTGPLVDELVTSHRRLLASLVDAEGQPFENFTRLDWARFAHALSDAQLALTALDEAASRG